MKLSVTVAASAAAEDAFVVWRGFKESIKKAAALGYQGVELALQYAEEVEEYDLPPLLARHGMRVSCITTGQMAASRGLNLSSPDEGIRTQSVEALIQVIRRAAKLCPMVNIGRLRGCTSGDKGQTEARFLKSLRLLADTAVKYGVTLLIEPVNRYELDYINTLDEGAALIEKSALNCLGLMPDLFHMNIEEANFYDSLVRNRHYIHYIHLADSNRCAPGMGHLDFIGFFSYLNQIGYNGWCSVEILPKPNPDEAAAQAVDFLLPFFQEHPSS